MTGEDKKKIYDLLKTADRYINGYQTKAFTQAEPVFTDDALIRHQAPRPLEGAPASESIQNNAQGTFNITQAPQDSSSYNQNQSESNGFVQPAMTASEVAATVSASNATPETIAQKIAACTRCPLCKTRTQTVPGVGVKRPLVLVIGEAPGEQEDLKGEPFVGAAGALLDKMLGAINLSRSTNCYIANIVKCRPPHNRDPLPEEKAACISFLHAQIHVLKPVMILAAGRIAAQTLLETNTPISELHGKLLDYKGIPFMATYHPSALLRDESLKRPAWEDLKFFKARLLEFEPGYDRR